MFTTLIVQPIFNLLVLIYALLPGHNFGLALIIFTVVVRLLMWPLVKKQLHQAKMMRRVQPELKRIKASAKGDKRKEQQLMMELYKERGINPFASIGMLILQIPILLGLYMGLQKVVKDPHELISFSYPFLQDLSWLRELGSNIKLFDETLFGVVDLTRSALGPQGTYWPALFIVAASAVAQYYQSKQLMPNDKDARSLRQILKGAKGGKQADQAEVNAAVGRSMRFFLPAMVFLFTVNLASALSLYWLVGGIVAYIQQAIVLRDDAAEMDAAADKSPKKDPKKIAEGEVVALNPKKSSSPASSSAKAKKGNAKKRRKK